MKILISGGHLTPALALLDYAQANPEGEKSQGLSFVFVGRLISQKQTQQAAREKMEVEKRGVKFISLDSPKLNQAHSWYKKLKLPLALFQAIQRAHRIIKEQKPDVFVSFGGYLAVPLAVASWLNQVPILTHEQTRAPGLASRFIGLLAQKVALTWPETKKCFSAKKTIVTGNPIRPEVINENQNPPSWFQPQTQKPILLIMGGSQGSHSINQAIKQVLPQLLKNWTVIHLTGQKTPSITKQPTYYPLEWVTGPDLAWIYTQSKVAIARAGANTVLELALNQIPTLYIPLPFARHQEQEKNATYFVQQEAGLLLKQKNLSPESLIAALNKLNHSHSQLKSNLQKIKLPITGAQALLRLVYDVS